MSTWPQWAILITTMIGVGVTITRFGEPKTDCHGWADLISPFVGLFILYKGGFFTPLGW